MATIYNEKFNEDIVKLFTFWIPSKTLRHQIRGKLCYMPLANKYNDKIINRGEPSQQVVINELRKDKPSLICRFGSNEYFTVYEWLKKHKFSKSQKKTMGLGAGFFPTTDEYMKRFALESLEIAKDIDVLAVWNLKEEEKFCQKYVNPNVEFITLEDTCPIDSLNPWSAELKGKKVLVIHPYVDTINEQFKKRELLFKNENILPEFELKTIKAVQSIADEKADLPYKDWFEALDSMKKQIDNTDFDIAIIGAGAYGMFLAHYCKTLGKKAIHMGGYTQLLFGILGKRWETYFPQIFKYANLEHWTRPQDKEKPKGFEKVEGGCYW